MEAQRWEYMILDVGVTGFWVGPNLDGDALTARLNEDLIIILKRASG